MLKKMYHLDLDAKNITHKLNFLGMQKRYTRTTKKNFKRTTQNAVQKKKKERERIDNLDRTSFLKTNF